MDNNFLSYDYKDSIIQEETNKINVFPEEITQTRIIFLYLDQQNRCSYRERNRR
jgi:hypothetical protein